MVCTIENIPNVALIQTLKTYFKLTRSSLQSPEELRVDPFKLSEGVIEGPFRR